MEAKEAAEKPKAKKKPVPTEDGLLKMKLSLSLGEDHPLRVFQSDLKARGIKNVEVADVAAEALTKLDQEYWEEKLKSVTPLEYRINMALANPEMREKLTSLLESGAADSELPI